MLSYITEIITWYAKLAEITEIIRWDNRGKYALVYVKVGQEEAVVIIGGSVELYHSDKYDMTQAYVKKKKTPEVQES